MSHRKNQLSHCHKSIYYRFTILSKKQIYNEIRYQQDRFP